MFVPISIVLVQRFLLFSETSSIYTLRISIAADHNTAFCFSSSEIPTYFSKCVNFLFCPFIKPHISRYVSTVVYFLASHCSGVQALIVSAWIFSSIVRLLSGDCLFFRCLWMRGTFAKSGETIINSSFAPEHAPSEKSITSMCDIAKASVHWHVCRFVRKVGET